MIRLLIADDSALMRKLLEGIFLAEGDFDIRLARNGAEALELVRSFDPQVVLDDVQMPGMDGLRCLGQIMIEAPRPVVMISALTERRGSDLEAIALGAIDFVAKPAEPFGNRPSPPDPGREGAMCSQRPHPSNPEAEGAHPPSTAGSGGAAATRGAATHLFRSGRRPIYGVDPGRDLDRRSGCARRRAPANPGRISLAGHGRSAHAGEFHRSVCQTARSAVPIAGRWVHRPMPLQAGTIYIGRVTPI